MQILDCGESAPDPYVVQESKYIFSGGASCMHHASVHALGNGSTGHKCCTLADNAIRFPKGCTS